jgi:uracil-DNA glycosylase
MIHAYLEAIGIQAWVRRQAPVPKIQVPQSQAPPLAHIIPVAVTTVTATAAVPILPKPTPPEPIVSPALNWDTLNAQVQTCQRCALAHTRHHTVFGSGHPHASLMFIGDVPGSEGDNNGVIFSGTVGTLLDAMLHSLGLKRTEVYLCNVLKCHPPHNRAPHVDEIQACTHYLDAQIDLLQPRLIVALGAVATRHLLHSHNNLSDMRGHLHSYRNIPLFVTYHPAYLLRAPSHKRAAWEDLKRLLRYLRTAPP